MEANGVGGVGEVTQTVHINLGSSSIDGGDKNDPANLDSSVESSPRDSNSRFQQLTDRQINKSDGKFGDISGLVKNREIPADSPNVSYNRLHSPRDSKFNKTYEY